MNRRQKIIVSITGIFIVLLALVGLTYAYFLTRITGNENEKSISVTTANLKLTYLSDDGEVVGGDKFFPSDTVYTKTFSVKNEGNENIEYGVYLINVVNTFERKDDIKYTLECTTDGTLLCGTAASTTFPSGIHQIVTANIEPNKTHTYTFKFTYKDTGTDQSVDMGKELSAKIQIFAPDKEGIYYPYEEGTLAYNIINNAKFNKNGTELKSAPSTTIGNGTKETYTYEVQVDADNNSVDLTEYLTNYSNITNVYIAYFKDFVIWYDDNNIPTGVGNKDFILNPTCDNINGNYLYVYGNSDISKDARYKVECVNNIVTGYKINPVAVIKDTIIEKELLSSNDDYGTSYYYRGGVEDNYVNFARKCWRIVRIQGDGSIRLVLEDQDELCSETMNRNSSIDEKPFGYTTYKYLSPYNSKETIGYKAEFLNSNSPGIASSLQTFQTNNLSIITTENTQKKYTDYLKSGDWCYSFDENGTRFNSKNFTFNCLGENVTKFNDNTNLYAGILTLDELAFAGVGSNTYEYTESYIFESIKENTEEFKWHTLNVYTSVYENITSYLIEILIYSTDTEKGGLIIILDPASENANIRPAITLKTGIKISDGNGTIGDPYEIDYN